MGYAGSVGRPAVGGGLLAAKAAPFAEALSAGRSSWWQDWSVVASLAAALAAAFVVSALAVAWLPLPLRTVPASSWTPGPPRNMPRHQ